MLPINYLPAAIRDFDEAFDWYGRRSQIVAERFANAIDAAQFADFFGNLVSQFARWAQDQALNPESFNL